MASASPSACWYCKAIFTCLGAGTILSHRGHCVVSCWNVMMLRLIVGSAKPGHDPEGHKDGGEEDRADHLRLPAHRLHLLLSPHLQCEPFRPRSLYGLDRSWGAQVLQTLKRSVLVCKHAPKTAQAAAFASPNLLNVECMTFCRSDGKHISSQHSQALVGPSCVQAGACFLRCGLSQRSSSYLLLQ